MLKKTAYIIPLVAAFVLLFFSTPVHASTLVSQPDFSTLITPTGSDGYARLYVGSFIAATTTYNDIGSIFYGGSANGASQGMAMVVCTQAPPWTSGHTCNDIIQSPQSGYYYTTNSTPQLNNTPSETGNDLVGLTVGQTYYVGLACTSGNHCNSYGSSGGLGYGLLFAGSPTPSTPAGDGDTTTHVIRINSPILYATTTSPISTDFDAIVNSADPTVNGAPVDGYWVSLINDNGTIYNSYGLLPTFTAGIPFNVATSSLTASTSGAYTEQITLCGNIANHITLGQPVYCNGITSATNFSVGTATYQSSLNFTTAGYGGNGFASTSCAVNFLGTFNLGDCLGYLISPDNATMQNFSSINLRNKMPFVYIYQIGGIRNALFTATSTATTTIGVSVPVNGHTWNITFLSKSMIASVPYTSWLKNIFDALLWIMLAELIYYQVIRSHDKHTPV